MEKTIRIQYLVLIDKYTKLYVPKTKTVNVKNTEQLAS